MTVRAAQKLARLLVRERELWESGIEHVAGVDEAGVGPLAGPLVAAAVIFPPGVGIQGVDDSKKVTPERRASLAREIRATAAAYSISIVDAEEIDRLNVYWAGLVAMARAIETLVVCPQHVLLDARRIPGCKLPQEPIVKGDARCHAIAAASILAKTVRDELMADYESQYPGYGFGAHKGYGTALHRDAIRRLGPCPIHRRSFMLVPPPTLFD